MISNLESVDCNVPRACVYFYDNPTNSDEEPETGWYWGRDWPSGPDSSDSRPYPTRADAIYAAVSYDPTPLEPGDVS